MIDFGRTSADYIEHRVPFAAELFERLRTQFDIGMAGQKILDVGAGTGLFGTELSRRGCDVTLVDPSYKMLSHASIHRAIAAAEALPFADGSFDVVSAAQCWHWFDRDRAPDEIQRVLHPGGRICVVYQTHVPLPGGVAEATEHLILRHCPRWRHANSTGVNGQVLRDLQTYGFANIETFSFDVELPFTRQSWRGFIRTISPIGASMEPAQVMRFDREHAALLEQFAEPLLIPHRVFAVVARRA